MSLSVAEWKRILDQPKNLGLKAAGAGVSEALRDVKQAYDVYIGDRTEENSRFIQKALDDLAKACQEVVDKHGKIFTTACDHLKQVGASATAMKGEIGKELTKLLNWERLREEAKDKQGVVQSLCGKTETEIKATGDLPELTALWNQFKKDLKENVDAYEHCQLAAKGAMADSINKVNAVDPAAEEPDAFQNVRRHCAELAAEIGSSVNRLPRAKPFGRG